MFIRVDVRIFVCTRSSHWQERGNECNDKLQAGGTAWNARSASRAARATLMARRPMPPRARPQARYPWPAVASGTTKRGGGPAATRSTRTRCARLAPGQYRKFSLVHVNDAVDHLSGGLVIGQSNFLLRS